MPATVVCLHPVPKSAMQREPAASSSPLCLLLAVAAAGGGWLVGRHLLVFLLLGCCLHYPTHVHKTNYYTTWQWQHHRYTCCHCRSSTQLPSPAPQ